MLTVFPTTATIKQEPNESKVQYSKEHSNERKSEYTYGPPQLPTPPPPLQVQFYPQGYPHNFFYHPQFPVPGMVLDQVHPMSVTAPPSPIMIALSPSPGTATNGKNEKSGQTLLNSAKAVTSCRTNPVTGKYTCHCQRSFTTSGHLARHMRIHTGEKNYVCPQDGCGARFFRKDYCMQHYRTHLRTTRTSTSPHNNRKEGSASGGSRSSFRSNSLANESTSNTNTGRKSSSGSRGSAGRQQPQQPTG